jgi:hypothetical protein
MLDIYVGNLPDRTNVGELRELFDGVVGHKPRGSFLGSLFPRFLRKYKQVLPATVEKFTIIESGPGCRGRYCRISGNSRSTAKRIITQLSGAGLHGRALEVRPFHLRKMTNDRRRAGWHFRRWLGVERRVNERRVER